MPGVSLGAEQRSYTARYDRVYMRGFCAKELRVVADKPLTPGHGDYISGGQQWLLPWLAAMQRL
jgi:hypothetical protein